MTLSTFLDKIYHIPHYNSTAFTIELYTGDIVEVILKDNRSSASILTAGSINNVTEPNIFTGQSIVGDCSEGKQSYSPVCGRWSMWNGGQSYLSKCTYHYGKDPVCGTECCNEDAFGTCWDTQWTGTCYRSCVNNISTYSTLPVAYKEDGSLNILSSANFTSIIGQQCTRQPCIRGDVNNFTDGAVCTTASQARVNTYNNTKVLANRYWFSARDAGGLRQRLNATTSTAGTDSDGILAAIQNPILDFSPDQYTGRKLYSAQYSNNADTAVKYLQYKFHGADHTNYTGGYVFQVKHTKCRRVKGEVISDSYANRGQILYVVSNKDPNVDKTIEGKSQPIPKPKEGKSTIVAANIGDLWLKVDNKSVDYKDSSGEYRITLSYNVGRATFSDKVLTPLLTMIKQRVNIAGMEIFQNLICLKKDASGSYVPDRISGSCSNFFNYIRAMLTLYIMTYGIMFLAGIVKASYQDVVIRVVKIGLVAGLLSGQTFLWFNDTIFNFVIGFTDQMIANFGGFQNISSVNSADNAAAPFMFLNTIFTKIFFTQTFAVQLMAVMGIGMVGIIYFIIVCAAVIILIIVGLRAVAVYIIAMVATAFLISLTPIFLTFMLFEQTYYLFEGWYKALFRFMMEPVILMIGIIVLTQIFTLYLDNVLSYSACWKCSLSFYLPFTGLLPFPGLENIPLFCIYWFGPWGLDNSGAMGQLGMDLSAMLGLVIIAFTLYGYADLAGSIASSLTSAPAGSGSSISTGVSMAQSMGQAALKRVGLDDQTQDKLKKEQVKGRGESRQALKDHEKSIIYKEKKLGIYESDTSKALKRGRAVTDDLGITKRDHAKEAEKLLNSPEVKGKLAAHAESEAVEGHGQEVERLHALSTPNATQETQDMTKRYGGGQEHKDRYDEIQAHHDKANAGQDVFAGVIKDSIDARKESLAKIDKEISGAQNLTKSELDTMRAKANTESMKHVEISEIAYKQSQDNLREAQERVHNYKHSYVAGDEMHEARLKELEERYTKADDLSKFAKENVTQARSDSRSVRDKFDDLERGLPTSQDQSKVDSSSDATISQDRVPSSGNTSTSSGNDASENTSKSKVPRDRTKGSGDETEV